MKRKTSSDFDPQLLSLFHRYVHGGINRREFLDGAAKFAIGGLTATALWDMLRPNYALAQQVAKDDQRIKAEYTMYPSAKGNSPDGKMRGLLARPASGEKFPAVLVIHENRGLNPISKMSCGAWRLPVLWPLDPTRSGRSAVIRTWISMEPKPMKRG